MNQGSDRGDNCQEKRGVKSLHVAGENAENRHRSGEEKPMK